MPKRKRGRRSLRESTAAAVDNEDLTDPHQPSQPMAEEPQELAETLTLSPNQQQDPVPRHHPPPPPPPPPGGRGERSQETQEMAAFPIPLPVSDAPTVPDVPEVPDPHLAVSDYPLATPDPSPTAPEVPDPLPAVPDPPPSTRKAPSKRKKPLKKPLTGKKLAAVQVKLNLLHKNLRPFPFVHGPAPDLHRHEHLFRALGLWDFIHLDLGADSLRPDLLAPFIAFYDPSNHRSEVSGARILVSRAHLGRALALPWKREKAAPLDDDQLALFSGEDASTVLADFISDWMVVLEDACVLPSEVVEATKLVKEGKPHKVDWLGLVWTMVERELQEAPRSGQCYYASHLQRLIKHQRPNLFEAVADPDLEPERTEVVLDEEEDDTGIDSCFVKATILEDFEDTNTDNHGPGLSLGLGAEVDALLAHENCKEGVEQHWHTGENDAGANHCLRRCTSNDVMPMECDGMSKEGEHMEGRAEERYDEELAVNFSDLQRLSSTGLLQVMDGADGSYDMPDHLLDPSSGDFLVMGTETHKNMTPDPGPASPFSFGNNCKREINDIDGDDNGDDMRPFIQGHQQKRMRSDGPWEPTSSTFDMCMEQIQSWMGKAKMAFVEKEQGCANAQMELQYASNVLQQKDQIIQSIEKARMDEVQKRELEASRYVHELRLMTHLVYGYKKSLKETRNAFANYRKKFPQGDEPLYNDVGGAGGLVLSSGELERQRLEKEEGMRHAAAELINDFGKEWYMKFTEYDQLVTNMTMKFTKQEEDFKLLKERYTKAKVSDAE